MQGCTKSLQDDLVQHAPGSGKTDLAPEPMQWESLEPRLNDHVHDEASQMRHLQHDR